MIVGAGNILLVIFLGILHQRAPISLMNYLRCVDLEAGKESVVFLTPCHSTPFYSYLHKNVNMQFLTCEPNLNKQENYIDEADVFYNDPVKWLSNNQNVIENSTYVILFESLYKQVGHLFNNLKICKRFFYSFVQQSERTDKTLLLLCLNEHPDTLESKIKTDL